MVNYFEQISKQFGSAGETAALRIMKLWIDAQAGRFDPRGNIALAQQCARNFERDEIYAEVYAELLECARRKEKPVGDTIFTRMFRPAHTSIDARAVSLDSEDDDGRTILDSLSEESYTLDDCNDEHERELLDRYDSEDLRREIVDYIVNRGALGARKTIEEAIRHIVVAGWESLRRYAVRKKIKFDAEIPNSYACPRGVMISRIAIEKLLRRASSKVKQQLAENFEPRPGVEREIKSGLISILAPLCRSGKALLHLFDLDFVQLVTLLRLIGKELFNAINNGDLTVGPRGRGRILKITTKFIDQFVANCSIASTKAKSIVDIVDLTIKKMREACRPADRQQARRRSRVRAMTVATMVVSARRRAA